MAEGTQWTAGGGSQGVGVLVLTPGLHQCSRSVASSLGA